MSPESKGIAFKLLVTVAILAALFLNVDIHAVAERFAHLDLALFAAVIALLCGQILLAGLRWHAILHSVGATLSTRRSLDNFIAGGLGNLVFLTSVGGLSVRAFLLLRRGLQGNLVAAGLIVERLVVAAGLALVFFPAALLVGEHYAALSGLLSKQGLIVLSLGGLGILLAGVLLFQLLASVEIRWIRGLADHLTMALRHPARALLVVALSCVIHLTGFIAVALIALGLGVDIPVMQFFAIMPLVAVLSSLPLGLGGWGVREGSMVLAFSLLGIGAEETIAISVLYGLAGIVSALVMAALFLTRRAADVS